MCKVKRVLILSLVIAAMMQGCALFKPVNDKQVPVMEETVHDVTAYENKAAESSSKEHPAAQAALEAEDQIEHQSKPEPPLEPVIRLHPTDVKPGDFVLIFAGNVDPDAGIFISSPVFNVKSFYPYNEGMLAMAGVDYRTKPGEYKVDATIKRDGLEDYIKEFSFRIVPKDFPKSFLTVTKEQEETRSDDSFAKDSVHTNRAKSTTAQRPLWEGAFIKPVEGEITTDFGAIRYVNEKETGRHSGIDISANTGTPVKSANNGRIALSMELIVTGNTIIIDHGMGVYTSYCHMDRLIAKEGDMVEKGAIIGEVGSTGFSTGAHLHWGVSIGTTFVNPWAFMEMNPLQHIENKNPPEKN